MVSKISNTVVDIAEIINQIKTTIIIVMPEIIIYFLLEPTSHHTKTTKTISNR